MWKKWDEGLFSWKNQLNIQQVYPYVLTNQSSRVAYVAMQLLLCGSEFFDNWTGDEEGRTQPVSVVNCQRLFLLSAVLFSL